MGQRRGAAEILEVITNPAKNAGANQKSVVAITLDGRSIDGLVRNEDNFSVQIQSADGAYYFFMKADLKDLQYADHPVMPTDYHERLSSSELNDLASYLMSVGRAAKPSPVSREEN